MKLFFEVIFMVYTRGTAVAGRKLGKFEVKRRRVLRKVGIGRPLGRGKLNKALGSRHDLDSEIAQIPKTRDDLVLGNLRLKLTEKPHIRAVAEFCEDLGIAHQEHLKSLAEENKSVEETKVRDFTNERKARDLLLLRMGLAGRTARRKLANLHGLGKKTERN